jgi:hypothetical protein
VGDPTMWKTCSDAAVVSTNHELVRSLKDQELPGENQDFLHSPSPSSLTPSTATAGVVLLPCHNEQLPATDWMVNNRLCNDYILSIVSTAPFISPARR